MKKNLYLAFAYFFALSSPAVVIDDFTVAQTVNNAGGVSTNTVSAGVGGTRLVTITQPDTSHSVSAAINTTQPGDALFTGVGTTGTVTYEILYNAGGSGLGSLDLTDLGSLDSFLFEYGGSAQFQLTIGLTDGDSSYAHNVGVLQLPFLATSDTVRVGFDVFEANGIDMTDIETISFSSLASTGADFYFAFLESSNDPNNDPPVVPEPSTTGLLLGLMAGCGAMLRRRMKK